MPECLGIARAFYVDVNDDGIFDIIASPRVRSNRFNAVLEVLAVFLSDAAATGGYCYSQQASNHLQPVDLISEERAKASLEREQIRLKLARFSCGRD